MGFVRVCVLLLFLIYTVLSSKSSVVISNRKIKHPLIDYDFSPTRNKLPDRWVGLDLNLFKLRKT